MTGTSGIAALWWPYLYIALAGWLATDVWRWAGVALGGRLDENSEIMVLVRCVATALVAAVIGNLVVYPSGALEAVALPGRIAAAAAGFSVFLLSGRTVLFGIAAAEAVLAVAMIFSSGV